MGAKKVPIKVKVDPQTALEIDRWADEEDRSRCRHLSVLARKLVALRKTHRADLERLRLIEAAPVG
jgi:hypothetical protein